MPMPAPTEACAVSTEDAPKPPPASKRRLLVFAAIIIFGIGAVLRMTASSGFKETGYDESLYRDYVLLVDKVGFGKYSGICAYYLRDQADPRNQAKLPPTRILYIFSGWAGKHLAFGGTPPANIDQPGGANRDAVAVSLHRVSLLFSILIVGLCGVAAWRMIGPGVGLGVMVLAATSPLGVHMGKHALVDGFFAFWATLSLWLLWENLQRPKNVRWLIALAVALALMVLAKESAIFVYIAMCGIIAINPWAKFGTVTRSLLLAGVLGPLLGVGVLVVMVGGIDRFFEIFRLFITKANTLEFVILNGDGPWYRYLLELIMMEPIVVILALTGMFTLPRKSPAFGFLLVFMLITYVIMCNLRYGHSLRFTTIWALPLAALAAGQVIALAKYAGRYAGYAAAIVFALMAGYGWQQYQVFFVKNSIYEPVPVLTLKAINILKAPPTAGEK